MRTDTDETEARLEERSAERRRRLARKERVRRWVPWVLCPVVLPGLGAVAFVWAVQDRPATTALIAAGFLVPTALSAFVGRRRGVLEAALWAAITLAAQVALVFGAGFVALGLEPPSR